MSGGRYDPLRSPGGRKSLRATTASLAVFLLLFAASVAVAASQEPVEEEDHYIVVLQDSIEHPGAVGQEHVDRDGGRLGFVYRYGPIGYSATLPGDAVEALLRDPRVRDVRLDDQLSVAGAQDIPSGVARVFASTNKALQIDEEANFTVNADVAVIDTGVNTHPDLVVHKRTYCNDTGKGATCTNETGTDETGHGTHVAGTIAAIDSENGVVGIAPSARIWAVKVLDPNASEAEVVAGIQWVTSKAADIEVANMSIQCTSLPCTLTTVKEAVTKSIEAGVVHVGIAGNQGKDAKETEYAKIPLSLTVSALADYDGLPNEKATALWDPSCSETKQEKDTGKVGNDDNLATFSNWGPEVEITAPGVCTYSTYLNKEYAYDSGTSMAAPLVAGAAAIRAALSNPNNKTDVEAIGKTLIAAGNLNWTDRVGDTSKERLLDLSNETLFK